MWNVYVSINSNSRTIISINILYKLRYVLPIYRTVCTTYVILTYNIKYYPLFLPRSCIVNAIIFFQNYVENIFICNISLKPVLNIIMGKLSFQLGQLPKHPCNFTLGSILRPFCQNYQSGV